jgi:hypothetical protein
MRFSFALGKGTTATLNFVPTHYGRGEGSHLRLWGQILPKQQVFCRENPRRAESNRHHTRVMIIFSEASQMAQVQELFNLRYTLPV